MRYIEICSSHYSIAKRAGPTESHTLCHVNSHEDWIWMELFLSYGYYIFLFKPSFRVLKEANCLCWFFFGFCFSLACV